MLRCPKPRQLLVHQLQYGINTDTKQKEGSSRIIKDKKYKTISYWRKDDYYTASTNR